MPSVPYQCALSSPLRPDNWDNALATMPDRPFVHFLIRGIRWGFRIGVTAGASYKAAARNLKSAYDRPDIISAYLQREVELGRLLALPSLPRLSPPLLQISPFGAIPKKYKPDKWRLIVDLSSPKGYSVNDAIASELCSVSYTSVDRAVDFVKHLGEGCLLAKLDLKEAYRAVPVHPSDQRLLAVLWQGTTYLDRALPFGLRSAPKLFSALTDAMMWMLYERGIEMALHYLDDFLILGPAGSPLCGQALQTTLTLCDELGFPVALEKTEGPATTLTFLGIEIDSVAGQVRLPHDKLERLLTTINQWMKQADDPTPRGTGKKRELLSLIGLLTHAATVVRPGRAFLRGLIDATAAVQDLEHWVHLNRSARADIAWWHTFLRTWNGISVMPPSNEPFIIVSDASGGWGCGAMYANLWFQLQWPEKWYTVAIAPKELVPIVMAVILWGPYWAGKRVRCLCDNISVVAAVNKGAARDPALSSLLRTLAFVTAVLDISLTARHLPGYRTPQQMHCPGINCHCSSLSTPRHLQSQPSSLRSCGNWCSTRLCIGQVQAGRGC